MFAVEEEFINNNNLKFLLQSKFNYNYINLDAIFYDETNVLRYIDRPYIRLKLRTAKNNVDKVFACVSGKEVEMQKTYSEGRFDFYEVKMNNFEEKVIFHFKVTKDDYVYYYNKQGIVKNVDTNYSFFYIPNFKVPEWAYGAIMYQIYVDRFYNGDKSNDVENNEYGYLGKSSKKTSNWRAPVSNEDVCNFYGGDLKGIIDKMGYLKDLGVDVIYLNPIFVSPSNHKYDIQDYDYVDPHYGVIVKDGGEPLYFEKFHNRYATMYIQRTTDKENLEASNKLFVKLVEIAHQNNIKVILDGVFNHCGAFNKWLDKEGFYSKAGYPDGAYKSEDSIYHDYFKWYENNWPNNDCYDAWWGHDNHPKLNYEKSSELYDYIIEVGKKWVSAPYNADGWRLDVAADLGSSKEFNHKFWKDFRNSVKEANPNAIILAEHYGDPSDWLQGDQWDTIMNYDAFMEPITWFLTGMEKHSEEKNDSLYCNTEAFINAMRYHSSKLSIQSIYTSMNELSNHDHSRFLTRTNRKVGRLHTVGHEEADTEINKGILKEAVAFQMTWPGAPTVYYGDEAGLTGWTDPDNRRTYPWGREDYDILNFHKEMIKIHKKYKALKSGAIDYLVADYGVLGYGRWNDSERIAVCLNNNSLSKTISIPVWKMNALDNSIFKRVVISNKQTFDTIIKEYKVTNGYINVILEPFSSAVFIND